MKKMKILALGAIVLYCGYSLYAASAVSALDRMAMADRRLDKGDYKVARAEYMALLDEKGIARDELLYRLAECSRALGDKVAARAQYKELLEKYPATRHGNRARLMMALAGTDDEKRSELMILDSDGVAPDIRACALYHLGVLNDDANAFDKAIKVDPKGKYELYAKFRRAILFADSNDPAKRNTAIEDFLTVHARTYKQDKNSEVAKSALYLAGTYCYSNKTADKKNYDRAVAFFRQFIAKYPNDQRTTLARTMAAWSEFQLGNYAACATLASQGGTDDLDYLRAMCAYSSGDKERAVKLFEKYLEKYRMGHYRNTVELTLSRLNFEFAGRNADYEKTIEAARTSAKISNSITDRMRLAWAYEKAGRFDDAFDEYRAIIRDSPDTKECAEALFHKALIDIRAERWSAAELSLKEALANGKNPSRRAESLYWCGIAAFMLEHDAEGAPLLKEALELGLNIDQRREARIKLADWDFKEERVAAAKAAYAALVREGACERMSAEKIRSVGYFLLTSPEGESALDAAEICGRTLAEIATTPAWRQTGRILEASAAEAAKRYSRAIVAYREAFKEDVRTEDAPEAILQLGILEAELQEGNLVKSDAALREAVSLNANNNYRRAKAYIQLAKNAIQQGDVESAEGYATVVVTLFDDNKELLDEANRILSSLSKGGEAK